MTYYRIEFSNGATSGPFRDLSDALREARLRSKTSGLSSTIYECVETRTTIRRVGTKKKD